MKKLFVTIFAVLSCVMMASAQDVITRKNGQDIQVTVQEVGSDYVKFKYFGEPDGPVNVLKKSEIFRILYESGRVETFEQKVNPLYDSGREPVAGIRPGMKYKELKGMYNPKEYIKVAGEMHPGWSGLSSFIVPGLGQCLNNEWGRGVGQFLGSLGLVIAGSVMSVAAVGTDADGNSTYNMGLGVVSMGCYLGTLGISIWSIVDAVKVAKVKNMYQQDLNKTYGIDINLAPSINYAHTAEGLAPTVGMTLALNF